MNFIKVSQGLEVHVYDRDDLSQKSFGSTRDLTALALPQQSGWQGTSQWTQGCRTVCAALRPSSRDIPRTGSQGREPEVGVAR